jgi:hypothetical protein
VDYIPGYRKKEVSGIKLDAFEYSDDVLHDYWTFLLE